MKKDLFTLTMASLLTIGLSSCGGETKTTTSQTESIQSADQAVDRVDTQTTKDKYGNTNTAVQRSQTYVPSQPVVKTIVTQTRTEE